MVSHISTLFTLACFLLAISPVLSLTTVSIASEIPSGQHYCIVECIYAPYIPAGIGGALGCATPYNNDCYCNTQASSVSVASSFISTCASSSCSGGDLTDDLTSIFSIYASYCMNAGFTQQGATNWYNPATTSTTISTTTSAKPSPTPTTGATMTTTQVTLVTQTAASTSGLEVTPSQGKFLLLLAMGHLLLLQVPLPRAVIFLSSSFPFCR
jgi:hypothetical protein